MKSATTVFLSLAALTASAQQADSARTFKATASLGIGYMLPLSQHVNGALNANWEVYVRLRNLYSFTVRGLAGRNYTDNRYPTIESSGALFSSSQNVEHRYNYTALLVGKAFPLAYKKGADFEISVGPAWVRYRSVDNVALKTKPAYVDQTGFISFRAYDYYAYDRIERHLPGLAVSAGVQAPWGRFVGNRLGVVACFSPAISTVNFYWGITLGKAR